MSKRAENLIVRVMREAGFKGPRSEAIKTYFRQIALRPEEHSFCPF
jgi:hypothetical protein